MTQGTYQCIYQGEAVLIGGGEGSPTLPQGAGGLSMTELGPDALLIGHYQGLPCYALGAVPEALASLPGFSFVKLRSLFGVVPDQLFRVIGKGYHLRHWVGTTAFCGRCGGPMRPHESELSRLCSACGYQIFPRLSPAVIVAVTKGDCILLARGTRPGFIFHSVLAGFVEPGETLEECVAREIREEVGIEVKNIRYFGSQEWPFPDSLMIAFTAEYASGELRPDPKELSTAGWFTRDALPPIPGPLSISRRLIDWFVAGG